MARSKRFELLAQREVNKDSFIHEWPEVGLVNMESPFDPKPSLVVEEGIVEEMDGKKRKDFDIIDYFIIQHCLDIKQAQKGMEMDSLRIARKVLDIDISRKRVIKIFSGLTPAKILEVVKYLDTVEMMMALRKMRARKTPANQAHVTNRRENPVLLAADAAEAALRGFAEETFPYALTA